MIGALTLSYVMTTTTNNSEGKDSHPTWVHELQYPSPHTPFAWGKLRITHATIRPTLGGMKTERHESLLTSRYQWTLIIHNNLKLAPKFYGITYDFFNIIDLWMHKNLNFVNLSKIRLHITKVTKLDPTTFMLGALIGNHKQLSGETFATYHGV